MFPHLHVHSPFSFMDGASSIQTIIDTAVQQHVPAMALTDHNSISGMARFTEAARAAGIKPICGAEITMEDGSHLTVLAKNKTGYTNLCLLLTLAHHNDNRATPSLPYEALKPHRDGLIVLSGCRRGKIASLILQGKRNEALHIAQYLRSIFGRNHFAIELQPDDLPRMHALHRHLIDLAHHLRVRATATSNVHYADKSEFFLHDVLTCVRTASELNDVHPERRLNAENYMHSYNTMQRKFHRIPEVITNAFVIADMCDDTFPRGEQWFPHYSSTDGYTPADFLRRVTQQGALARYGRITSTIRHRIQYELDIIISLGVESYFLIVWDILRFARQRGIRYTGRGSAANSVVAYCLFITDVDPIKRDLLFERFLSYERAQMPDIDVDFDARFRHEVVNYVMNRYGKDHVASVCTFYTYRARSAIRDVGKALGIPQEQINNITRFMPNIPADGIHKAIQTIPELRDSDIPFERYKTLFSFCQRLAGFPRHIGTHLGGIIISREPIATRVPVQRSAEDMPIIQFDKNDIEQLGLIKLDLLSLRTLSAIDDAVISIRKHESRKAAPAFCIEHIPEHDAATFAMLRTGETIGVFQLESPAQRSLHPRLGTREYEDIIASLALIRPGPVQGNMVEPFLARRNGQEQIHYVHPKLQPILEKTYGVILYQEQVIEIASAIAGFTPGEADMLRQTLTHYHSERELNQLGERFVARASVQGVSPDVAHTVFSAIRSYAGYGFCEAHAASFADIAYKTAYLVRHYPSHFFAAVLNHYPMGFYSLNTICLEARRRGIKVFSPDINESDIHCIATDHTIRIGLKHFRNIEIDIVRHIVHERRRGPYTSFANFRKRVPLPVHVLEYLILGGAFDTLHANRRALLWHITPTAPHRPTNTVREHEQVYLTEAGLDSSPHFVQHTTDFSPYERFLHEYAALGFHPEQHIMSYHRSHLLASGVRDTRGVRSCRDGQYIRIAGLVIRPNKPPTRSRKTIVFFTLEDEFGHVDVTVFEDVYQRFGKLIFHTPLLLITGHVQKRGHHITVIASSVHELSTIAPSPNGPKERHITP